MGRPIAVLKTLPAIQTALSLFYGSSNLWFTKEQRISLIICLANVRLPPCLANTSYWKSIVYRYTEGKVSQQSSSLGRKLMLILMSNLMFFLVGFRSTWWHSLRNLDHPWFLVISSILGVHRQSRALSRVVVEIVCGVLVGTCWRRTLVTHTWSTDFFNSWAQVWLLTSFRLWHNNLAQIEGLFWETSLATFVTWKRNKYPFSLIAGHLQG